MAAVAADAAAAPAENPKVVQARAKIADVEGKIKELEEQIAAAADDAKPALQKQLKKQKKTLSKAEKGLKLALKKAKGNAWDKSNGGGNKGKKDKKNKNKNKGGQKTGEAKEQWVNPTPKGQKKDLSGPLDKKYNSTRVEAAWGAWWEEQKFFSPDPQEALQKDPSERFVIVIPPPNVTGSLHIGHALTVAIEDVLVRWHRMSGKSVLWLPGTDHAGIATQTQVEKKIYKESQQTRHDIGREKFLENVWEWKQQYGGRITRQLRRLGASVDWSREVFTMDERLSRGVTEAFVRMHEKGLIYRAERLINWCSKLNTAISNIEVDTLELTEPVMREVPGHTPGKLYKFGVITSFAYKLHETDGEIIVATTRLETMLGDTAVAVHPDDPRYTAYHGMHLVHPFRSDDHPHKLIPLVTDAITVDMAFGTGAVKITPAHDENDYACGQRHDLDMINILTDNGAINEHGGELFQGMMRYDCREALEAKMKELGMYRGEAPNPMQLPLCSRSKDIIEKRLKPQWFVNTESMAADAVACVESGDLRIHPERRKEDWFKWLGPESIRHWCISRQLWWGHRIPAYLVQIKGGAMPDSADSNNWVVGRDIDEAMRAATERTGLPAESIVLHQDPDVLDTWFSSGLFPFSTMGWPDEESPDLKAFFPGHLLETGYDILFFWVARMVMMSRTLTGQLPFKDVYLHALVRDKFGEKMSKSKGNVIDPLMVINGATLDELVNAVNSSFLAPEEITKAAALKRKIYPDGMPECGADALRFGLLAYMHDAKDVNLDIMNVYRFRKFCQKLWQLHSLGCHYGLEQITPPASIGALRSMQLAQRDRWILSRLRNVCEVVNECYAQYRFAPACNAIFHFFTRELAAVWAELAKPSLRQDGSPEKDATLATLHTCLEVGYRLVHPTMPYITEELWQRLPVAGSASGEQKQPENGSTRTICLQAFPNPATDIELDAMDNPAAEKEMELVTASIDAVSRLKARFLTGQNTNKKPSVVLSCSDQLTLEVMGNYTNDIQSISRIGTVSCADAVPAGSCTEVISEKLQVNMLLTGIVDFATELPKLVQKVEALEKRINKIESRRTEEYLQKAKASVQEKEIEQMREYRAQIELLNEQIQTFERLAKSSDQ